jgi:septum formation topological specificity factor MinE
VIAVTVRDVEEVGLPNRSQSRPRLSGNGNHEPKKLGPITGSQRMDPPVVSMNMPAWPRPVMRMLLLRGESSDDESTRRLATILAAGREARPRARRSGSSRPGCRRPSAPAPAQVVVAHDRAEEARLALLQRETFSSIVSAAISR